MTMGIYVLYKSVSILLCNYVCSLLEKLRQVFLNHFLWTGFFQQDIFYPEVNNLDL